MDIGEAEIPALIGVDQSFMVDAEEVENGRIEVVHVDRITGDVVGEVVGFAVDVALFDTTAGEPHAEAAGVVIAAVVFHRQGPLAVDGATELAAPDDEGVIEETPLFQITDQGRTRLIHIGALATDRFRQQFVLVPAAVIDLHEADIPFDHAAGEETAGSKGARLVDVGSVHLFDVLRFIPGVDQLRYGGLHPVRHLVLGDARHRFRVADGIDHLAIETGEGVEHLPACGPLHSRGIGKIQHRITDGTQGDSLIFGRQHARTPKPFEECLRRTASGPCGLHDHEGGQA